MDTVKCKQCGTEWEKWVLNKWAPGQVAAFRNGEGCPECLASELWEAKKHEKLTLSDDQVEEEMTTLQEEGEPERRIPLLAGVGYILGVLEILGGIVLCAKLWPGAPEPGYRWLFTAYIPALTWLAAGIISGFFFFVISAILTRLHNIQIVLETLIELSERQGLQPEQPGRVEWR